MYIREKKLIAKIGAELKKRIPFLSHWNLLHETESSGRIADIVATARSRDKEYSFCIEVRRAGYPQYVRDAAITLKKIIQANLSCYPVIVVPFISEQSKKICDEYNVGYFDFSGNAKIAYENIYIYTEGKDFPTDAAIINQSLFSPKAARIAKLMLSKPDAEWAQKDIVKNTGLSKGMVSRIVRRMIAMGYAAQKDKKLVLTNFDDLFSAWAEAEKRRREVKKSYYVWAQNPMKLMKMLADRLSRDKIRYAFTKEAGASLVAPFSTFDIVSVYTESLDDFPAKALSATEADKGFNLTVIEAPDEYIFMTAREKGGIKIADNFQLYADLEKNPLRGKKQADLILALIRKELR